MVREIIKESILKDFWNGKVAVTVDMPFQILYEHLGIGRLKNDLTAGKDLVLYRFESHLRVGNAVTIFSAVKYHSQMEEIPHDLIYERVGQVIECW